ncbi:hypothetical protein ACF06D_29970 [Streptomyces griseoluteus]|uniref:hypothetical protein n=1 Tax=Streptomyces TaxID=1883 RepID=UPI000A376450|nr:hypothetical protein [Streptomyces recifensis]
MVSCCGRPPTWPLRNSSRTGTWEWFAALAVDHSHFRTPPAVEDIKEGSVQTVLPGRSLIVLLIEL